MYSIPDRIRTSAKLPGLPAVATAILELAKQEEPAEQAALAQVIGAEPTLAAQFVRLANSSAYGSGEAVSDLDQALAVLGVPTAQSMAISLSLAATLPAAELAPTFDLDVYWHRSILTAVAARSLARMTARCPEEDSFLTGLLANLGELVLGACLPEDYSRIAEAVQGGKPSLDEEQALLGFHRAEVGGGLLELWGLPVAIHLAVAFRDRFNALPPEAPEEARALALVVHVASLAVEVITGDNRATALVQLASEVAQFGIPPVQLNTFLLDLEHDLRETSELMELAVGHGPSHREVLVGARDEIMSFLQGGGTNPATRKERRSVQVGPALQAPEGEDQVHAPTGLATREYLDEVLATELGALKQGARIYSLGLVCIELDDYEGRVASRGIRFAEEVEARIGKLLAHALRSEDLAAYSEPGCFAVLVSRTSPRGLAGMTVRVGALIRSLALHDGDELVELTGSLGAACAVRCDAEAEGEDLWRAARQQLEDARARGGGGSQVSELLRLAAA